MLNSDYDDAGRKTSSTAQIGADDDYANSYSYDALGRLRSLVQTDQNDNAVADKRLDFTYTPDSQLASISRYAGITTANLVAYSTIGHDALGRIEQIDHHGFALGSTYHEQHLYGYDNANRLIEYNNLIDDIFAEYGYDHRGQLTSADDSNSVLPDEDYAYDANGNRAFVNNFDSTGQDYETGSYNRIESDGTYTYQYDDEGNLLSRDDLFGHVFYYTWDHRNRLVHVAEDSGDHHLLILDYVYDAFNQLVGIRTDQPFESGARSTALVHDGGQVVLQFDAFPGYPVEDLEATDVSHRYLWGAAVDQLLADEQVDWNDTDADGEVLWALTDKLGSVRDMLDSNGELRLHRQFDSFGNIVDETHYNASGTTVSSGTGFVDEAFAFTGRYFDKDTGLQNNLNRWYDPKVGRWLSEDPIGFGGGDANLYRYVGNSPTNHVDSTGLASFPMPPGWRSWDCDQLAQLAQDLVDNLNDRMNDMLNDNNDLYNSPTPKGRKGTWPGHQQQYGQTQQQLQDVIDELINKDCDIPPGAPEAVKKPAPNAPRPKFPQPPPWACLGPFPQKWKVDNLVGMNRQRDRIVEPWWHPVAAIGIGVGIGVGIAIAPELTIPIIYVGVPAFG